MLPILLLLLFGIVQYGTIFLVRNQLTEAASDAARTAVTQTTMAGAEQVATAALDTDVPHDGAGLVGASCGSGGLTCAPGPATSCPNVPAGYQCLKVTVSYDYATNPIVAFPLLPAPSSITASSTVLIGP